MALSKYRVGDLIDIIDERNSFGITNFCGININKEFMPTAANTDGLDERKYKVVRRNRFVFSGMQTGRDQCIRIGMYNNDEPIIVSPAYITFEVRRLDLVIPCYFFMFFKSFEKDRLGAFYSDGSIRSNLDWDRFCDIEIELPDLPIQEKFVNVYLSMLENQKNYERGLEDLKLVCDAYINNLKNCNKKIGPYIQRNTKRNDCVTLGIDVVKGFNNDGQFIKPMRLFSGEIKSFKIIGNKCFVYNSRINAEIKKLSVALNVGNDLLVSPAYESFYVKDENSLYPFYLYMFLQRESFARKVLFDSFGSSTIVFGLEELSNIEIPIPDITVQKSISNIYMIYKERWNINEKLKQQIKDICPILIKGSIEEAKQ